MAHRSPLLKGFHCGPMAHRRRGPMGQRGSWLLGFQGERLWPWDQWTRAQGPGPSGPGPLDQYRPGSRAQFPTMGRRGGTSGWGRMGGRAVAPTPTPQPRLLSCGQDCYPVDVPPRPRLLSCAAGGASTRQAQRACRSKSPGGHTMGTRLNFHFGFGEPSGIWSQ